MKPLAVIGLDPGTTSAYAILDLQGNILNYHAAKEMALSDMIVQITGLCLPLLTATDKAKVPSLVEQFSRKLGTKVCAPSEDLKREEKRILLLSKDIHYNGAHEQDCIAAALSALNQYHGKLHKIERFIREHQLQHLGTEFTKIAIQEDLHFALIKEILTRPTVESTVMQRAVVENRITKRDFLALYQKLNALREEKKRLEKKREEQESQLQQLTREKSFLSHRSDQIDRRVETLVKYKEQRLKLQAQELEQQRRLIEELRQKIREGHHFTEKSRHYRLLKKMATLSLESLEQVASISPIREGDLLLVENPAVHSHAVIEELARKGVILFSLQKLPAVIQSLCITARIGPEDIIEENDYFALMDPQTAQQKMENKGMVEKIVKEYQENRNI